MPAQFEVCTVRANDFSTLKAMRLVSRGHGGMPTSNCKSQFEVCTVRANDFLHCKP